MRRMSYECFEGLILSEIAKKIGRQPDFEMTMNELGEDNIDLLTPFLGFKPKPASGPFISVLWQQYLAHWQLVNKL